MKILGFTGTEDGMAPRQLKAVMQLLQQCDVLHLGDCIGADKEAYDLAVMAGIKTVGHPPTDDRKRANLQYEEERPPLPYMERNKEIAREGVHGLIAAPDGWVELLRSGTWSTVRRARDFGREIWIVRPDGSIRVEAGRVNGHSHRLD